MPSLPNERVKTLCYGTGEPALVFAQSRIGGGMNAVKVPMLRIAMVWNIPTACNRATAALPWLGPSNQASATPRPTAPNLIESPESLPR